MTPHYEGIAYTMPSTLHMDGTSPVVVKVQATTDDLRAIHRKRVRLVVRDDDPGYSPEFTATSRGLTAEALLREAARLARFDGTYDALDLADRIDEFLAEPCSNYTAQSWSPTSPQPEDDRCVNCGHPNHKEQPHGVPAPSAPDELPDSGRTREPWEFFDGD